MTNELAESDVREAFADIRFDRTVSRIIAGARRRQHRKRLTLGAIPAVGLVAAGGTVLLRTEAISATNVACYSSASPQKMPLGGSVAQTTGESPEDLCRHLWETGVLPGEVLPGKPPYPVPPLRACAARDENEAWLAVFPTDDESFCTEGPVAKRMRLAEVPDDYKDHIESYVEMRRDATQRVRDTAVQTGRSEKAACLSEAQATELATSVLADHGQEGWQISVVHSKHDAPCWMHINFQNAHKEVTIYSTDPGIEEIWINDAAAFR